MKQCLSVEGKWNTLVDRKMPLCPMPTKYYQMQKDLNAVFKAGLQDVKGSVRKQLFLFIRYCQLTLARTLHRQTCLLSLSVTCIEVATKEMKFTIANVH